MRKKAEDSRNESREGDPTPLVRIAEGLHVAAFAAVSAVVLLSPWFFGSWEMWWFWGMATVLAAGFLCSGLGTVIETAFIGPNDPHPHHRIPGRAMIALALCAPFLFYALVRSTMPSAPGFPLVEMECERSLMLFFTPVGLSLVLLLSSRPRWRRALLWAALANAAVLSVYGLVNHFQTNDTRILWVAANDFRYTGRLSGSFYCPNHFAAYVNLFICLLLGAAFTVRVRWWKVLLLLLAAVALLVPDYLSLSRGGLGALAIGLCATAPFAAFRGRALWKRLLAGPGLVAVLVCAVLFVRYATTTVALPPDGIDSVRSASARACTVVRADGTEASGSFVRFEKGAFQIRRDDGTVARIPSGAVSAVRFDPASGDGPRMRDTVASRQRGLVYQADLLSYDARTGFSFRAYNPIMNRLAGHPLWKAWVESKDMAEFRAKFADVFFFSFDRGQYIAAALRAWRSNPVWGIGPGQHSPRWAQFAPSDPGKRPVNGDPKTMRRPRLTGTGYHLYEVHSDWTQLLEEYGIVGFSLFLIPMTGIFVLLVLRQAPCAQGDGPALARSLPLGALFASAGLFVHSLFDFSLQIPAIVWTLAFLLSCALLENGQRE